MGQHPTYNTNLSDDQVQEISSALTASIDEARSLRDSALAEDGGSRTSLVLAQVTLLLQRIARGGPATAGDFCSLLRAAGLAEQEVDREVVGA